MSSLKKKKKTHTQLSNYYCQYITCMSICGKFQQQDHWVSFKQLSSPERQTEQSEQATTAANNFAVILEQHQPKLEGSIWALTICRGSPYVRLSGSMFSLLIIIITKNKMKNFATFKKMCFAFAAALCLSKKKFLCTHIPFIFILFYGIDCLLAGSKAKQITCGLRGALTGTRR